MRLISKLDHQFVWHPFTQMRDWLKQEPITIVAGKQTILRDAQGRTYLDANSSIWTNLHGHQHPAINRAIARQLKRIAHSSALGLANEPASVLAARLVRAAAGSRPKTAPCNPPSEPVLEKVFFSDDGSTAIETALKMAYVFMQRTGQPRRTRFLSLSSAYHGDTLGAVSLGHSGLFHKDFKGLAFKSDEVMAPYCYRCPFNRATPERNDARAYRKCRWECLDVFQKKFEQRQKSGGYAGFVFEPLMQGAAGMVPQPAGWLGRAAAIARHFGALLIADEVMTGFGRTGQGTEGVAAASLFACDQEAVGPDFMALAKGMTGGYLPMAATLTTKNVFEAFLGDYTEFKAFFHGHSYTGNQLGAVASLTSLDLLENSQGVRARRKLQESLSRELDSLWKLAHVGDIRQTGLIAGIELVKNWRTRDRFPAGQRVGFQVCEKMARLGVLTRSIGDVIVLMPPYCTTEPEVRKMVAALGQAITAVTERSTRMAPR